MAAAAARRNALGKGLGALIEDASSVNSGNSSGDSLINEIEVSKIETNPYQPRTEFDEEALNELAESIKELGIIQPITLRKVGNNKFQIISGERRFRASQMVGLTAIPAFVRTADDQGMLEMALVENIQREDLDAIEVAISYQRLIDECKLTQESMSERVGKKRSTITNYLRLLRLPAELQLGIRKKLMSMGHARALVNVEDEDDQLFIFEQILNQGLSVRKVEEMVKKLKNGGLDDPQADVKKKEEKGDNAYEDLQNHLSSFFKSKVELKRTDKGNGKIVIPFKTDEELEQIIAIFDQLNS